MNLKIFSKTVQNDRVDVSKFWILANDANRPKLLPNVKLER
jgi:hypothetical protein